MALQAEVAQPLGVEPPLDHLQGRRLLADEQDRLAGGEGLGDHVGDRLALARARRPVDDEVRAPTHGDDRLVLAAVGVEDVEGLLGTDGPVEVGGERKAAGRLGAGREVAGDGPAEAVGGDLVAVAAQVLPHRHLLEAEDPQGRLVQDGPAGDLADRPADLVEVAGPCLRVVRVQILGHQGAA